MKSASHGGEGDQAAVHGALLRLGGMWWLGLVVGLRLLRCGAAAELRAVEGFLRHAEPRRLHRWQESLVEQLTGLAPKLPEEVAVMLVRVYEPEPANVPPHAREAIERAWLVHAAPSKFDDAWDALSQMSEPPTSESRTSEPRTSGCGVELLIESLCAAVREIGREQVSADFRRDASRRLQQRLAHSVSAAADSVAFELFELVCLPDAGGHPPAYWQCVLGDRARRRGGNDEAIDRYRAALRGHQEPARSRLAYLLALKGHQLLLRGEFSVAIEHLRTAESLTADSDYRLLSAIARLLGKSGATADIVSDLARLRGELAAPGIADFWIGVAQLESGDHVAGAATLRRSFGNELSAADPKELAQLGSLLLHIAEGGPGGLVALSRELLHRHGDGWAQRSPVPSDAVVADVADRDPALLSLLLSALPDERQLSLSTRMIAAHAMVRSAVQASEAGIALNRLQVVERLLQGG
jgi:tetratricopeptide (TPR) repeat protein